MNIEEKYIKHGYKSLDDTEVLKLLLYISDCKKIDETSNELIKYYGSVYNVLTKDNNIINEKFNLLINVLKDFTKDYFFYNLKKKPIITSCTRDVISFLKSNLVFLREERVDIIFLSNIFEVINYKTVSTGTIDKSVVFIRNIIKQILDCNAKYIILAHNHPSGSLIPSKDDIDITKNIKKALKLIDISLVDHIIISSNGYYSFAEGGLL